MENKKEPLMSFNDWIKINLYIDSPIENYTNYHTQWHLNNAKEFVADGVRHSERGEDDYDYDYPVISKQSIHNAIDNYIEINLNKEL